MVGWIARSLRRAKESRPLVVLGATWREGRRRGKVRRERARRRNGRGRRCGRGGR